MKKGFTLIELLAVIVILAIIALIATPLVLNVIEDSKKNAFKNSAYGIIDAAELRYAEDMLDSSNEEQVYTYNAGEEDGPSNKKLNYKGNKPKEGEVRINSNGKVALAIYDGIYCAEKSFDNSEVKISKIDEEDCRLINLLNSDGVCGDSFVDNRDNDIYKTVKIGNQCWMAENLRYIGEGEESCLPNPENPFDCPQAIWDSEPYTSCCIHNKGVGDFLGEYNDWSESQVLYQWGSVVDFNNYEGEIPATKSELETAFERKKGICPDNWIVPSDEDWNILINHLGGIEEAANYLKSPNAKYWDGIDGDSNSGFNALPAGFRTIGGSIRYVGDMSHWWTSSLSTSSKSLKYFTGSDSFYIEPLESEWYLGYSVRCLLDL